MLSIKNCVGLSLITFGLINHIYAVDRIIIKYKNTGVESSYLATNAINQESMRVAELKKPMSSSTIQNIVKSTGGIGINQVGRVGTGAYVIRLQKNVSSKQMDEIINNIKKSDPNIEYVEEDKVLKLLTTPQINPKQWDMQGVATTPVAGWIGDYFTGGWSSLIAAYPSRLPGESIIVAVVDTGYTPHQDFVSNLYGSSGNYGYQFISDCRKSGNCPSSQTTNTTINYQPNGLDLGDYLTAQMINDSDGFFSGCNVQNASDWHGTHVTGTVIGQGYDSSTGFLGGAYGAKVLPVRTFGKCGAYTSDIENGMLWASGYSVPITQNSSTLISGSNPPANILSMSFGGDSSVCPSSMQSIINTITGNGTGQNSPILVVAAGNSSGNVSQEEPANCNYVISVAAKGPTSALAFYSNWGNTTITASGGDEYVGGSTSKIFSSVWGAVESYNSSSNSDYAYYEGTSMATPHVSAAIADIISYLKYTNQSWTYSSIVQILQNTSDYNYTNCNSGGCATSGMLNVESAMDYVLNNINQQIITPSSSSATFTVGVPSSNTITFTNNNSNSVLINNATLVNNTSGVYSIGSATTCVSTTLGTNQSCTVIVNYSGGSTSSSTSNTNVNASSSTSNQLQLLNGSNYAVSTVNLVTSSGSNTTTSSSGGGCTSLKSGDDFSLIIILLGSGLYFYRKSRKHQ